MCTVYVGHDIEDLRCYIMTDGQILRPGTRLQVDVRTVAPGGPVREPQEASVPGFTDHAAVCAVLVLGTRRGRFVPVREPVAQVQSCPA